jgi:hypothetical protein
MASPQAFTCVPAVLLAALSAALGVLMSSSAAAADNPRGVGVARILFIGNSYTFYNNLPGMVAGLAKSGARGVETGMAATGGWTLAAHAGAAQTLDKLTSRRWDFVILQEQSQIPSVQRHRSQDMYPAARALVGHIRAAGATPVFFQTWAHRGGWPTSGLHDYESMQQQIDEGYRGIAQELDVMIAPVGDAWLAARQHHPEWDPWQADGSHPAEQGSYLAACVFHATLFRESPEGLSYVAQVPKDIGRELQAVAAQLLLRRRDVQK